MKVPDCHTYFNFICFHNYIIMQYANTGNGILKKKSARTLLQVQASQETSSQKTRPAISDKPQAPAPCYRYRRRRKQAVKKRGLPFLTSRACVRFVSEMLRCNYPRLSIFSIINCWIHLGGVLLPAFHSCTVR